MNYLGYMLADRNERLPEALQLIQGALDREPGNGAYLDSLGWVYFRMGKFEEAEQNLKMALEKILQGSRPSTITSATSMRSKAS